jgi:hypothetical protein
MMTILMGSILLLDAPRAHAQGRAEASRRIPQESEVERFRNEFVNCISETEAFMKILAKSERAREEFADVVATRVEPVSLDEAIAELASTRAFLQSATTQEILAYVPTAQKTRLFARGAVELRRVRENEIIVKMLEKTAPNAPTDVDDQCGNDSDPTIPAKIGGLYTMKAAAIVIEAVMEALPSDFLSVAGKAAVAVAWGAVKTGENILEGVLAAQTYCDGMIKDIHGALLEEKPTLFFTSDKFLTKARAIANSTRSRITGDAARLARFDAFMSQGDTQRGAGKPIEAFKQYSKAYQEVVGALGN